MTRRRHWPAVLLWVVSGLALSVSAQEPEPPASTAKPETPAQKKPDESIDRELEQSLLPAEAQKTPSEVLDRAVNQMRTVSERIEAGQAGTETQQIQQQVLDDLSRLIDLLQNPPPPPPPNPDQQPPPQNDKQQNPKPEQQNNQQQQQQKQPQPQEQQQDETQRKPQDGTDSEERLDEARAQKERAAARERLFKDIWGHLPEAVRNRLLNNFSEEYLPKYAPEVRKYFEDLGQRRRNERDR